MSMAGTQNFKKLFGVLNNFEEYKGVGPAMSKFENF